MPSIRAAQKKTPPKNITASFPLQRIQFDLVDLTRYQVENEQYCWLLNIIDVFSKYAYSIPMKNKNGDTVKKELSKYCSLFDFQKLFNQTTEWNFQIKLFRAFEK